MRDRIRAAFLAAVTLAMSVMVAAPTAVSAAGPKVAVIVGPVGSITDQYRTMADRVASAATTAGASVVKVYSPNATWANVKAAVNGANVIVYFGHGNGYPNPYTSGTEYTDRVNGFGLNTATTNGDADSWSAGTLVYCGEKALLGTLSSTDGAAQRQYCGGVNGGPITPAAGFTMVYAQAHYAPGFGERYTPETPLTTLDEAKQRVTNYSTPILRLGGTYFATAYGDADQIVSRVLAAGSTTYGQIFSAGRGYSASTLTEVPHPDVSGAVVRVQQTVISSLHFGDPDYWYAFAGNPNASPGLAAGTPVAPPAPSAPPAQLDVTRLAGGDRYETAAAISAASFAPGVAVAYVAVGSNFPDALAAGAAAARRGGPVLLVTPGGVPASTAAELARLRPSAIKVVGGAGVIGDGVLAALRPYATSGSVSRVAGDNRFATAAAISADTFSPGVPVAYVATGRNFPDALAGVAAAGSRGGPILLTAPSELSPETAAELARLRPATIVVLGGAGVVGDGVLAALRGYATTGSVARLAGQDRYATAVAVSTGTFSASQTVFVATGANFPDALGGGPVAATVPGPLLLVPGSTLPSSVAAELQRLGPDRVVILGGVGVVSDGVIGQIGSLLGG
ncbi:MAG TPA: cell wall-binding repeat-containing protein [Candidatus Limnocylindria bacterium]|nr:cell wall-binding repeat-containing protein [Candidatus Limnocylindria bacterium]